MERRVIAQVLIFLGIFLIAIGLLFLFPKTLSFFGKLKGDIVIEGENYKIYIPITSALLFSLILTIILNLIYRIFK